MKETSKRNFFFRKGCLATFRSSIEAARKERERGSRKERKMKAKKNPRKRSKLSRVLR